MIKRALVSVSDKTGIEALAGRLHNMGVEIISTGGTAKALEKAGIPVTNVSDVTGFPECLDGRVKTMDPHIHAGILAMRDNPQHMEQLNKLGIKPIDMVVINLYPFRQTIAKPDVTLAEAIENIDIGGPTMLRAAAKNYQDVAVLTDPADYEGVLAEIEQTGDVSRETKFRLAAKVFQLTAHYDAMIAQYLRQQRGDASFEPVFTMTFEKAQDMRYGENPHQSAVFYREIGDNTGTLAAAKQLHGKELSFNNINDANGALMLLKEFTEPTVVAAKHANPCGVASADTIHEAYVKAYEADPVSIFGGIVAANREIDEATAQEINKTFIEIVMAPSYTPGALKVLESKKNIRILAIDDISKPLPADALDMKKVAGGLLVQTIDDQLLNDEDLKVVTKNKPTDQQMEDLIFAWKVVKYTKSNGIAIAKDKQSLGIGPGQVNRIWAVEHAIARSGDKVKGAVLASDAFFPFSDCVEAAGKAGIAAIIQPGGSIRDQESIDMADKYGMAMVFTGMRHFRH
ncbi:bifunctional phosphoribosylaminoimidazolecarboxamide formyltransferase/IMP cyclohydrolase [Mahella sp.]|uniref:bifunctional phosphoribosylaminoimidazolecarboxamide formyltransferase/IMP cyclohydrolase n=1 Tax=Mahella sp. TaxID=2798721 RepID=UPI0025C0B56E|nr:bifunctional phosphoribosylaminoimidazolecarboxamide formyltransferase/IMP cyclohydrolase [Mahella sp.]MBZ4666464.1 cyclohydrolase [Mahella sp.]